VLLRDVRNVHLCKGSPQRICMPFPPARPQPGLCAQDQLLGGTDSIVHIDACLPVEASGFSDELLGWSDSEDVTSPQSEPPGGIARAGRRQRLASPGAHTVLAGQACTYRPKAKRRPFWLPT
jgi:hypothetical protein